MILRPKPSLSHRAPPLGNEPDAPVVPVPSWLRRTVEAARTLEDAAIAAGAAIGALDAVVRRQERWAGAWRHLALSAAAVTARQVGRVEDELALRDAVFLTRPGDDVGPAGSLLLAWRRLALLPAEHPLAGDGIAVVLDEFGLARDDEAASDLAGDLRQLSGAVGVVEVLNGAFAIAERYGFGRNFGAWLADALLAQRLGWSHAVPLGTQSPVSGASAGSARRARSAIGLTEPDLAKSTVRVQGLLLAQARAALRAIDLSTELGRRAERLLTAAPKLRAKGADLVVERLLSDDAVVASEKIAGMSDRGLRRLFDRLVDLGAVRELSGRSTFRIYGL
ncbi:DUF1403 family protein [Mesorhizobium sp. M0435]|uniref:DUF1403 family protein n=1 Tax=Mesorhizobium sp. M0435 TaxID=2956944 RepID=UPI00333833B6